MARRWLRCAYAFLPGLCLVGFVAWCGILIQTALPDRFGSAVGSVLPAMLLGLVIGNLFRVSEPYRRGIKLSFEAMLPLAIVLLGAKLSLAGFVEIGGSVLALIVVLIVLALSLCALLGKWAGMSSKMATLIAVGTAVCGNTAISVTAPAIQARDEDVSFAIATNTLFGTLAVFFYPMIGHWLGLSDYAFGLWSGTAVNDTSQVVAVGFSYSEIAGETATAVKLTRNALLGVVVVGVSMLYARDNQETTLSSSWYRFRKSIPIFVWGFLAMAGLQTLGLFNWLNGVCGRALDRDFARIAQFFILFALAGIGLNTRFRNLKGIGFAPLWLGLTVSLVVSLISFWTIHFLISR